MWHANKAILVLFEYQHATQLSLPTYLTKGQLIITKLELVFNQGC